MPTDLNTVLFGYSPERFDRRNPRDDGFEDTQGYDEGRLPACAINNQNYVVELHAGKTTTSKSLNLRIAIVERGSLNFHGVSQTLAETGQNPTIALSDADDVIVMYDKDSKVHYRLGRLNIATSGSRHTYQVDFTAANPDTQLPNQNSTSNPSIGLNTFGVAVEVHIRADQENQLYFRRGSLNDHVLTWNLFGDKLLPDKDANDFKSSSNPSVALNNSGKAVVVFQKGNFLYYSVGTFQTGSLAVTESISWVAPTRFHTNGGGVRPSVALNDHNEVIIVFESSGKLYQGFGRLGNDNQITFNEPLDSNPFRVYDNGITPQVAMNAKVAVQVFNRGSSVLLGNAAFVFDHANWMGDNRDKLLDKTLAGIALPASHDSGAFAGNDAQTQDLLIRNQLRYGVRYFDIRPNYDDKKPTKNKDILDEKLTTYHDVPGLIALGPPLTSVIAGVRDFMRTHNELVILKLSHFRNFNDLVYSRLINLIKGNAQGTTGLTQWLYQPNDDETRRLADLPLSEFLKPNRGTVLVLVDRVSNFADTNSSTDHPKSGDVEIDFFNNADRKDGIFRYRDWYDPEPGQGDITVFDVFSDTLNFDQVALGTGSDPHHPEIPGSTTPLPQAQLLKFNWFDGKCRGKDNVRSDTPCDLFLLSWTLTPIAPSSRTAFLFADAVNGYLVPYLNIPKYDKANDQGFRINLLFTDAVEFSRSTDVAMLRNGLV